MVYDYPNTGATAMASANRNGRSRKKPPRDGLHALIKARSEPFRFARDLAIAWHGAPPEHRPVAAAHEAGHTIVGVAVLGGVLPVNSCAAVVQESGGAWGGYYLLSPCALAELDAALLRVAGLAGEMMAGLAHPASSWDELLPAAEALRSLRASGPPRTLHQAVVALLQTALRILEANRPQWEAVRRGLMERDTLGYAALRKRVSGVVLPADWRESLVGFFEADDVELAALADGDLA
jgi:hypothetical protein